MPLAVSLDSLVISDIALTIIPEIKVKSIIIHHNLTLKMSIDDNLRFFCLLKKSKEAGYFM